MRLKYPSTGPTMGYMIIALSTFLLLCQGFNTKTRQLCCNFGTNHSSNGKSCTTIHPPIPSVLVEDEKACLKTADFCCKTQFRLMQCEKGKVDAKKGFCISDETDKKDCCEACQMGIETKRAGDPCIENLGMGSPYSEAFISCCEETDIKTNAILSTTPATKPTPKTESVLSGNLKDSRPSEEFALYPRLSEENVCEAGEFCSQLCAPTGETFKCVCFSGYELMKDGVSCKPIKRATGSRCEKNNPCDHDCLDTGTAIECACRKGYELATDKKTCKDIDECTLDLHDCEIGEECENAEGTYYCYINVEDEDPAKCPVGHKFNAENSVCDDVDECEIDLICPPPKVCKNSVGSFLCEGPDCPPGFRYKASIESCADIDECMSGENNCKDSQICLNTKGNYTCIEESEKACPPGFKKNGITFHCEDINECEDNVQLCPKDEHCANEVGGYKCLKIKQPRNQLNTDVNNKGFTISKSQNSTSCPEGFKYNFTQNTCDDVNECQLRLDNCSPLHRCDNTVGSFYCTRTVSCGTGYTLNTANDLCEDDDECALGTNNCYELGPNYKCKNQMGTYRCELIRPLYHPVPLPSSTTIKPLVTSPKISRYPNFRAPSSTSTSTSASVPTSIRVNPTFTTRPPIPITNPWGEPFHSFNRNSWWSYQPSLKPITPRYTYPRTTQATVTAGNFIPSRTYPVPFNPYTSNPYVSLTTTTNKPIIKMVKQCLPGYKMNDRELCEDINDCESNPCPRGMKCLNFNGRFECSPPLFCEVGYEPNEAGDGCIDVNECARGTHNCSKTQICRNGLGYYTCECPPGHNLNRATLMCEDINECVRFYKPCGNYANCINTVGSYRCDCKDGFRKNQSFCDDINECQETPGLCDHNCINIYGFYRCACKPGFTLNSDNRTCTDINECEKFKDRKLCIGTCVNTPGSYACECPKGYKLGNDNRVCIDIDECLHNVCGTQDACVNTRGGYKCYPITCATNYIKDPNYKARCKRLTCDPRDNQCLLMPEQYSYQYTALASNLPLPEGGSPLYTIKGPVWRTAKADFSLKLLEVNAPPGIQKVDESYIKKVHHQNNIMGLNLVKSIEGPQEVKLEVKMKLFHGNSLIGSVVVYIVIVVSEYPF